MSAALTVAVVGRTEVAEAIAKKSTESDIGLFHRVQDGRALTLVTPRQYPEKFPPLLVALALADRAVFVVTALDRTVAETAATLDLFDGLPAEIRLGPAVGPEELARAFRGLRLAEVPMRPLDPALLRDELVAATVPPRPGPVRVGLDHSFPVKGVGPVALGFVRQGTLAAHATLRLYPTEILAEVRSIQVHDVDVREAAAGERVGLALKGVALESLARGQVLAPPGSLSVATHLIGGAGRICPYYRGTVAEGTHLHALVGTQFVPAVVRSRSGDGVTVETDRPVAYAPGDRLLLADLSVPQGPRCVGRFSL